MSKQSTEINKDLLNAIIKLSEEAKKAEFLLEEMVIPIEEFLYGNVLQNILNNLLDENNTNDLYNEFGISDEEISKIRSYPSLVEFVTDENPKGTAEDYLKLKETLATMISPKIIDFINNFENTFLLKDCEEIIKELRKHCVTEEIIAQKLQSKISVGFTDSKGHFSNLDDSKFDYLNKYSDEQLDQIYNVSPYNREVINRVRELRKSKKE